MNAGAPQAPSPRHAPSRFSLRHALHVLLVFVPIAAGASALHADGRVVFACAALAIVPLAALLGDSTEKLSSRLGSAIGGWLNATLGNAAELILALVALQHGLTAVVKASLTGSILGNSLLVLGLSMVAGGARRESQRFDRVAATAATTLLALAAIGLMVPALFHQVARGALAAARADALERDVSVEISAVLFAAYLLSLLFTLRTHRHLYGVRDPHGPAVSLPRTLAGLLVTTVLIAFMSELLAGTVEQVSLELGFTPVFIGVVVLATVGNAAEHSTAVLAAMRNRMDLALHIAVGSSTQIALFVAPLLVFVSLALPGRPMDLSFTSFEVLAIAVAVAVVHLVAQDGESNWLEGALLLAVYVILGIAFFFLP